MPTGNAVECPARTPRGPSTIWKSKHNPGGNEIFTAQGPGGRSHEIRRFQPNGTLVDSIFEDDPEFAGGIWLG